MKTKLLALFATVLALASFNSCVAPSGYGYRRPYYHHSYRYGPGRYYSGPSRSSNVGGYRGGGSGGGFGGGFGGFNR